jgi:DNA polymerase III subunit beta
MKVAIDKKELIRIKDLPSPKSGTMPILNNYLFSANDDGIKVTATDLEVTAVLWLKAKVEEQGNVLVDAKTIKSIIATLGEGEISLKFHDKLTIKQGRARFNLDVHDTTSYPSTLLEINGDNIVIGTDKLKLLGTTVGSTVLGEISRPIFNGMKVTIENEKIVAVSTDGKRITELTLPLVGNTANVSAVFTPAILNTFLRLNADEQVEMTLDDNGRRVMFISKDVTVFGRQVSGRYPDYKAVMDIAFSETIRFNNNELRQAVKQISTVVNPDLPRVEFSYTEQGLVVSSQEPESGAGEVTLQPISRTGTEPFAFTVNCYYLLHYLNSVETEVVEFQHREIDGVTNAQMLILPYPEPKDYGIKNLLMPLRMNKKEK